jgi:hypothetical protein
VIELLEAFTARVAQGPGIPPVVEEGGRVVAGGLWLKETPNAAPPYATYWVEAEKPGDYGGFGVDQRHCELGIVLASYDAMEVERLYQAVEDDLLGRTGGAVRLEVVGWAQVQDTVWLGRTDDPGDVDEEDVVLHYAGGLFAFELQRDR